MRASIVHPALIVTTVVLASAAAVAGWRVRHQAARVYAEPAPALVATHGDSAAARGEHLVRAVSACTECHAQDLGAR